MWWSRGRGREGRGYADALFRWGGTSLSYGCRGEHGYLRTVGGTFELRRRAHPQEGGPPTSKGKVGLDSEVPMILKVKEATNGGSRSAATSNEGFTELSEADFVHNSSDREAEGRGLQ